MKLKSEEEFRRHTCPLSLPSYPSYFSSIGVFNIETAQYGSKGFHDAMLVCYSYERAFGGIFQDMAFGATAFEHPLINSIQKPYIAGNYLPDSVTNIISKDGKFKPPPVSRKRKRPQSSSRSTEQEPRGSGENESDEEEVVKRDEEPQPQQQQQHFPVVRADLEWAL